MCNKVNFTPPPPGPVTRPFLPNPTPPNASFQAPDLNSSGLLVRIGLAGWVRCRKTWVFWTLKKSRFTCFFSRKVVCSKGMFSFTNMWKSCPISCCYLLIYVHFIDSLVPWFVLLKMKAATSKSSSNPDFLLKGLAKETNSIPFAPTKRLLRPRCPVVV